MKVKPSRTYSRQWFDEWFNRQDRSAFIDGPFKVRSESILRMAPMKAEADRDRFSA